jgi:hypothetical protein
MVLWRNTIQLFHQHNRPKFIGPFKAAKMNYLVECLLMTRNGENKTPDIVASGSSGWLILEITTQPGSKEPKLGSYITIDPRYLAQQCLIYHDSQPDVISSRLSFVDDGPYCQLILRDRLEVIKADKICNQSLRVELIKSQGEDLRRLPAIAITLLPEMRPQEIRMGLIDIIMHLFKPGSEGKRLIDIVDDGLERISGTVSVPAKSRLRDSVKREMDGLLKGALKGYLFYDENDGVYKATDKFRPHPKTMERIALALKEWAGIGPQKTLDSWTAP